MLSWAVARHLFGQPTLLSVDLRRMQTLRVYFSARSSHEATQSNDDHEISGDFLYEAPGVPLNAISPGEVGIKSAMLQKHAAQVYFLGGQDVLNKSN